MLKAYLIVALITLVIVIIWETIADIIKKKEITFTEVTLIILASALWPIYWMCTFIGIGTIIKHSNDE